jgi:hypothetical protein
VTSQALLMRACQPILLKNSLLNVALRAPYNTKPAWASRVPSAARLYGKTVQTPYSHCIFY